MWKFYTHNFNHLNRAQAKRRKWVFTCDVKAMALILAIIQKSVGHFICKIRKFWAAFHSQKLTYVEHLEFI